MNKDHSLEDIFINNERKLIEKLEYFFKQKDFSKLFYDCKGYIYNVKDINVSEDVKNGSNSYVRDYMQIFGFLMENFDAISWIGLGFIRYLDNKERQACWNYIHRDNINTKVFSFIEKNYKEPKFSENILLSYDLLKLKFGKDYNKHILVVLPEDRINVNSIEGFLKNPNLPWEAIIIKYKYNKNKNGDIKIPKDLQKEDEIYNTLLTEENREKIKISEDCEKRYNLQEYLEKIENYILLMELTDPNFDIILSIPAWNFTGISDLLSLASILSFKFNENDKDEIEKILKILKEVISSIFYLNKIHNLLTLKILDMNLLEYATKSAISAIMSRNMSHNIGSHVLNRVIENINLLNVQDHALFFRYLQERMDFIAQVTTNLNPTVHSSFYFVKDIIKNFLKQQHLLHYIARAEDLKGISALAVEESLINIHITHKDENKEKEPEEEIKPLLLLSGKECIEFDIDNLQNDIKVSIPGSVIGLHAIYTIFENIIRNAAKHSFSKYSQEYRNRKKHLLIETNIIVNKEKNEYEIIIGDNYSFVSGLFTKHFYKDFNDKNFLEEINEEKFYDFEKILIFKDDGSLSASEDNGKTAKDLIEGCRILPHEIETHAKNKNGEKNIKVEWNLCCSWFCKYHFNKIKRSKEKDLIYIIVDSSQTSYKDLEEIENKLNELGEQNGEDTKGILKRIRFIDWDMIKPVFSDISLEEKEKLLLKVLKENFVPLHIKISKLLNEPIVNEDGSLKKSGWGIAEIKISAGYLLGLDEISISKNTYKDESPIVEVVPWKSLDMTKFNKGKYAEDYKSFFTLGFKFRLKKPTFAFICSNLNIEKEKFNEIIICEKGK